MSILSRYRALYQNHRGLGTDKWSLYFDCYEGLFELYRSRKDVRVLEIGVQNGGSLEIIGKILPDAKMILGCDIDPRCGDIQFKDDRISVVIGSSSDIITIEKISLKSSEFDVIIDDGSHTSSDIIITFCRLFPLLKEGGKYVIEDLHCSYWQDFHGGIEAPFSSLAFLRRITDYLNVEHWKEGDQSSAAISYFSDVFGVELDEQSLNSIYEISFRNSLVVISKEEPVKCRLGHRVVVGAEFPVWKGAAQLHGTRLDARDERSNPYGLSSKRSERVVADSREQELQISEALTKLEKTAAETREKDLQLSEALMRIEKTAAETREKDMQLSEALMRIEKTAAETREKDLQLSEALMRIEKTATETREKDMQLSEALMRIEKTAAEAREKDLLLSEALMRIEKTAAEAREKDLLLSEALRKEISLKFRENELLRASLNDKNSYQIFAKSLLDQIARLDRESHAQSLELNRMKSAVRETSSKETILSKLKEFRQWFFRENYKKVNTPSIGTPIPVQPFATEYLNECRQRFIGNSVPGSVGSPIGISVLMPVYNTPISVLKTCIESVVKQSLASWELIAVDDGSTDPEVWPILKSFENQDSRIRAIRMQTNCGISRATQEALNAARYNYVSLLDHDDELTCDALAVVVRAIENSPNVEIFYSDECRLDKSGLPLDIFAKPDWSPILLTNCMYLGHLTTYKKSLVERCGGFRSEFDFSQDYDLALRATEIAEGVQHIPKVLYGWRAIPQSAAAGGKDFARETNIAALQDAANRRNWDAIIHPGPYANQIIWRDSVKAKRERVSIIIPSDNVEHIKEAVHSIALNTDYPDFEVILVTNSTISGLLKNVFSSYQFTSKFVNYDKPFNFSDKCNEGAAVATGAILVFFNDDVRPLSSDWLNCTVGAFNLGGVGVVGAKLLYENDTIQHAGMVTGVRGLVGTAFHTLPDQTSLYYNFAQSIREVSTLCGALIAVKKVDFEEVGGFDARNTPIYHSDVDFCFKIRELGLSCVYTPYARLRHLGHASLSDASLTTKTKSKKDKSNVWLLKRWGKVLAKDPYFPEAMRNLCYHDSPDHISIFPGSAHHHNSGKDVLVASHDLSASGAPRVVLEVAKLLFSEGFFVVVMSPTDGPMRQELEAAGITVVIDPLLLLEHPTVTQIAEGFDLLIANTAVCWPILRQMRGRIPSLWYIHEIGLVHHLAQVHSAFADVLGSVDQVICGSSLAAEAVRKYRSAVQILEYGIPANSIEKITNDSDRLRINLFGSYEPRKGQDLLLAALLLLDEEQKSRIEVNCYGRIIDDHFYSEIKKRLSPVTKLNSALDYVAFETKIAETDLLIVPSRDDTLPLVTLSAMSIGIPVMCTRQTGTSEYIVDNQSGYIIEDPIPDLIKDRLTRAIEECDAWKAIGKNGKTIFDNRFSLPAFRNRFLDVLKRTINSQAVH